jgi:hypothetical protein
MDVLSFEKLNHFQPVAVSSVDSQLWLLDRCLLWIKVEAPKTDQVPKTDQA